MTRVRVQRGLLGRQLFTFQRPGWRLLPLLRDDDATVKFWQCTRCGAIRSRRLLASHDTFHLSPPSP